jgi:hypothetical protein
MREEEEDLKKFGNLKLVTVQTQTQYSGCVNHYYAFSNATETTLMQ